jgi:ribosome-binding factor A
LKKRPKQRRSQPNALCGQTGIEDGMDPREFSQSHRTPQKDDRKLMQLCRQIFETLELALAGESDDDDILVHLRVLAVTPAPNASQLLVCLQADPPDGTYDAELTRTRLQAEAGRLRCEIAAAITRKRAPRLIFEVIGPHERREETQ